MARQEVPGAGGQAARHGGMLAAARVGCHAQARVVYKGKPQAGAELLGGFLVQLGANLNVHEVVLQHPEPDPQALLLNTVLHPPHHRPHMLGGRCHPAGGALQAAGQPLADIPHSGIQRLGEVVQGGLRAIENHIGPLPSELCIREYLPCREGAPPQALPEVCRPEAHAVHGSRQPAAEEPEAPRGRLCPVLISVFAGGRPALVVEVVYIPWVHPEGIKRHAGWLSHCNETGLAQQLPPRDPPQSRHRVGKGWEAGSDTARHS
mmetsp:Transcript_32659/g.92637  ORF Transcript_32659/g.92637 Transcript_32659/m.92637 type:complete len:263 (-) Transcript_32659:464-1252(-)